MKNKKKNIALFAFVLALGLLFLPISKTASASTPQQRMYLCSAHNTQGLTFEYSCWNRTCGQVLVLEFCERNTNGTGNVCTFDHCR